MEILGIDIGGSGIKGAPVDVQAGNLTQERCRISTPQPATPAAIAEAVAEISSHFSWQGPIGCTFPAIVKYGVTMSAANVDDSWIGTDAAQLFKRATDNPVTVLNDADAAGIAEMRFGAGRDERGIVFMLTFGTGIGSAVFVEGQLMPNTELGHIELGGREVEPWAAERVRKAEDLSWKKWGRRVDAYLKYLEMLFSPDLFIIGGGVSRKGAKFMEFLEVSTPIVTAELLNDAGIVGAAMAAHEEFSA